jgi:hypothetical protein
MAGGVGESPSFGVWELRICLRVLPGMTMPHADRRNAGILGRAGLGVSLGVVVIGAFVAGATPPAGPEPGKQGAVIERGEAAAMLEELGRLIEQRSACAVVGDGSWRAALAQAKGRVGAAVPAREMQGLIESVLRSTGDVTAGVERRGPLVAGESGGTNSGRLPFLLEPVYRAGEWRFVAVSDARSKLIGPEATPFVDTIDGRPVREWLEAAAVGWAGLEPYRLRRACAAMSDYGRLRGEIGGVTGRANTPGWMEVGFASADGGTIPSGRGRRFKLWSSPLIAAGWPVGGSRVLAGGIGYLRPAAAERSSALEVWGRMVAFKETRGLVLDLRGDEGCANDALSALATFLVQASSAHVVAATARELMIGAATPEWSDGEFSRLGYARLGARHIATWEFQAITALGARPEAGVGGGERFGALRYLVVNHTARPPEGVIPYFYTRPVVVLTDGGTSGPTERMVLGLLAIRNGKCRPETGPITIVGQKTGGFDRGGEWQDLGRSFRVRMGAYVVFGADGRSIIKDGLAPDVALDDDPLDRVAGGTDHWVERAVSIIEAQNQAAR